MTRYGIRRGSGGRGKHRGGDGIIREMEFLSDAEVTLLTERRAKPPYGLAGGEPGCTGVNELSGSRRRGRLDGKTRLVVKKKQRLLVRTPGGGGWGTGKRCL